MERKGNYPTTFADLVRTSEGKTVEEKLKEAGGSGSGISEAPSDGKKYVRSNANWVEETKTDISQLATKTELANKTVKSAKIITDAEGKATSGEIVLTDGTKINMTIEQAPA